MSWSQDASKNSEVWLAVSENLAMILGVKERNIYVFQVCTWMGVVKTNLFLNLKFWKEPFIKIICIKLICNIKVKVKYQ